MANNTPESPQASVSIESASNEALTELEQLRLIVFGQARAELESKIDALQMRLSDEMDMLQSQINTRFTDLGQTIEEQHKALKLSIQQLNDVQVEDKNTLEDANKLLESSLVSQIEMAENAGKDDAETIHKRIDQEVTKLETGLENTMQELLAQLEQVSKELSSSKTDRKTLAQMLSNMASNLEEDS